MSAKVGDGVGLVGRPTSVWNWLIGLAKSTEEQEGQDHDLFELAVLGGGRGLLGHGFAPFLS